MTFHVPEKYRMSKAGDGNNGFFIVRNKRVKVPLFIVASDGLGWEHVSVSLDSRCPTWGEMCHVKELFWDPDDTVIQYHPPAKDKVNDYPYCLHLWRPLHDRIPEPPYPLVGDKGKRTKDFMKLLRKEKRRQRN